MVVPVKENKQVIARVTLLKGTNSDKQSITVVRDNF